MRRPPRLQSLGAGLALCAALVAAGAAGCETSSVRCGERRVMSRESPDRKYTAAAFTRKCVGAREEPGEIVTHVNLHGGLGEPPPDADGLITSGEVLVVEGARKVSLVWRDAKSLSVECADCAGQKVRAREASWKDVRVSFDLR